MGEEIYSGFRLLADERLDDLVRDGLKIIQSPSGFCFSMDAVLLANFASVKKNDLIVDLGTGTGVLPLLLSTRNKVKKIIGLEIQQESVDRAQRSITGNDLGHLIEIVEGDICTADKLLGRGIFDLVTCNPPYLPVGRGEHNQAKQIAVAKHEILCSLNDVISAASKLAKYGGRFAMVHRPERLNDIIILMNNNGLKPRRLQFVYPRPGKKSNMILIEALMGGKPELTIMEPFFVYDEKGQYTRQFWDVYYPGLSYPYSGGS